MQRKIRITSIIVFGFIVGVLLFGWLVWPTFYTHTEVRLGMFGKQKIRTDRFSGQTQVYGDGRWQKIEISPNGRVTIPQGTVIMVGE